MAEYGIYIWSSVGITVCSLALYLLYVYIKTK